MVQNAAFVLKNRQWKRCEWLEKAALYQLYSPYFR